MNIKKFGKEMRVAIENAVCEGLDTGDTWIAILEGGEEIEFRPGGYFQVLYSDSDTQEQTPFYFEVVVRQIPSAKWQAMDIRS